MAVLQHRVSKRGINGTEMHIKNATEEKNSEDYGNMCI
jgi:phage protein D